MEKTIIFIGIGLLAVGTIVFLTNYFSKKAIVKRHLRKAVLKRIDSRQVESYIVDDAKYSSGIFNDPSEVLENYLNSHDKKSEDFIGFNKSLRYKEGILEEGEVISVLGKASWKHAESGEWSDDFGKLLIIGPTEKMPVYLSDAPL
ncbi:MAG: hypothetical protein NTY96_07290 [Bacteroidetes bacterium]|nr:hypothetical protein [Bacteroidota bacterium]